MPLRKFTKCAICGEMRNACLIPVRYDVFDPAVMIMAYICDECESTLREIAEEKERA